MAFFKFSRKLLVGAQPETRLNVPKIRNRIDGRVVIFSLLVGGLGVLVADKLEAPVEKSEAPKLKRAVRFFNWVSEVYFKSTGNHVVKFDAE